MGRESVLRLPEAQERLTVANYDRMARTRNRVKPPLAVREIPESIVSLDAELSLTFPNYLPPGQGTVSVRCFFAIGCWQTGQFLCHILNQPFPQLTRGNAAGHVMLSDHCVELFALLKCPENRERLSVRCDCAG
jgi:hypothetical protein